MNITSRTVIKKYDYAQVNLVMDFSGKKYIEKIQFHKPPVTQFSFPYEPSELEIYDSILVPLEIPHSRIVDRTQNEESTTFIMEFIDGTPCESEPKAECLYFAAEKIGAIYDQSKKKIARIDQAIMRKYTLTKETILEYINVINKYYAELQLDQFIDRIFENQQGKSMFVNHGDMQIKNFICNDDLHIIDWGDARISSFFTDLYSLLSVADELNADADEIKRRFKKFSQIDSITDEDIYIGGLIGSIVAIFQLLIYDCPTEWIEDSYNSLQKLIRLLKC